MTRGPDQPGKEGRSNTGIRLARRSLTGLILIGLAAATVAVYWPVRHYGFSAFDDEQYIVANPRVLAGLTKEGVGWALTAFHASNWHPVTWLSHMLDVELFGLNPGAFHLVNLLFHLADTLLLFLVLSRMTGAPGRSGFVAALFALHPLHVESVAWVAERKDVLSAFFWILTMGAYARYAQRPCAGRYLPVFAFFVLGLMAKPMLVTLPFVLLLLDFWPLGRFPPGRNVPDGAGSRIQAPSLRFLLLEKTPLFLAAAASCAVTYLAQEEGGAISGFPLPVRAANALTSYAGYLWKTVWPSPLAVYYPHPGDSLPSWKVIGAAFLLIVLSIGSIRSASRRPWLPVGWFWYVGTLVPVIGLVQVGGQAMADRYTYVPLIGIFIAASWGAHDLFSALRLPRPALPVLAGVALLSLLPPARSQLETWRSDVIALEHALEVTSGNWLVHYNLGLTRQRQGNTDEAIRHYRETLRFEAEAPATRKHLGMTHNNLGAALEESGRTDEAVEHYREAIRLEPNDPLAHRNLGVSLQRKGRHEEAMYHYREVLRVLPGNTEIRDLLDAARSGEPPPAR